MNFTKIAYTVSLLIVGLGLAVNGYSQSFLTNDLVAYYPFNGNASDAVGTNNGTVVGASLATDRFGQTNSCYSFALNNHIGLGSGIQLGSPGTAWSASVWFKTTDTKYVSTFLTDHNPIPDVNGYSTHFWLDQGTLGMNCKSDVSPVFIVRGATTLNDGLWHFAAFVADGNSNLKVYADGQLDGQASYDSTLDYAVTPFWRVNYLNNNSSDSLTGSIDEIRIYNRALSASEVQQLYAIESGPRVDLIKAVKPSFSNLTLTTNYQMQISGDLSTWTNQGSPFTATNTSMVYPQYFDVDNWNSLFFRLKTTP
jgi:hypothetical protein